MPIRVCRFMVLCGTVLCLWLTAAIPSLASPCSEHNESEAPGIFVPDRGCFELGIGYQYQHFNVLGTTFHNNGYNVDVGMYLFDLVTGAAGRLTFGVEGTATVGFGGNTGGNPSLAVKSVFQIGRAHV